MLIHDPAAFSVVLPVFQGSDFLRRVLDYLQEEGYAGRIAIADSSTGAHREFSRSCPASYPGLRIDLYEYDESLPFAEKVIATLEKVPSRNVLLHANDDFMVPAAVEDCVRFLEEHSDYSSARGRMPAIALERKPTPQDAANVEIAITTHPMFGYPEADPVERVIAHMNQYSSTFYSVHRRKDIVTALSYTHAHTKNVIFFQYLSSCLMAFQGRICLSDQLYYVRQNHARSWSAALAGASYEHWPLLVTSKEFSRLYDEFKSALLRFMKPAIADAQRMDRRFDEAAARLFGRSLSPANIDSADDKKLLERIGDPGSAENTVLRRVVGFALRYPDTY